MTLGAKPETIAILADPSLRAPLSTVGRIAALPLKLIEKDEGVNVIVAHSVRFDLGKGGGAIGLRDWRHRGSRLSRWWLSFVRLGSILTVTMRTVRLRSGSRTLLGLAGVSGLSVC
jgi:hypothetical protein